MRSFKLLTVAVLTVSLILVSTGNAFAIQIDMHPTCGQPPPVELTVTGLSGDVFITVKIWGSGWENFDMSCGDHSLTCALSNIGTTGGFTVTFRDDFGSASATYTVDCPGPVGGVLMPTNTFVLLSPWLAVIGLVGCIGTVLAVVRKRQS